MKKTFKFFGIAMLFAMTMMVVSCTKEPNNANKLIGTWECTANSVQNPGTWWDSEVSGCLIGHTVTFKADGTFEATSAQLLDGSTTTGYWSISQEHLYINSVNCWKLKGFSETKMKIETLVVDGEITPDAGENLIFDGPIVREFKKK